MASETGLAERYLIPLLRGLTTGVGTRWYNEAPPAGANVEPVTGNPRLYGLIRWIAGTPVDLIGPYRGGSDQRYIIEVLRTGSSFSDLNDAYDIVDAALHASKGVIPGKPGYIVAVIFQADWKQLTVRDGVHLARLGGEYKVLIESNRP